MTIATSEEIAERYQRVREEIGDERHARRRDQVRLARGDGGPRRAPGSKWSGRTAPRISSEARVYGDAFRWHFIGHLQSNKVKVVNRLCELVHSLSSESAGGRLSVPALLEVNLSGEDDEVGRGSPDEIARFVERYPVHSWPDDDAAARSRPRDLAARTSVVCASSRPRTASTELSMGTSQDYRVAVEEGATLVRIGEALFRQG